MGIENQLFVCVRENSRVTSFNAQPQAPATRDIVN